MFALRGAFAFSFETQFPNKYPYRFASEVDDEDWKCIFFGVSSLKMIIETMGQYLYGKDKRLRIDH